jgi:tRNA guanosine-2'-O-methyltransferase
VYQKSNGYKILGLEQTANSKMLNEYKFPAKCVMLLGKEKEGIPQEFLALLDECIEIPQFGVIRSLNVHVSGALCLWEYTKQHLPVSNSSKRD